jgi:hypothetical protein
LHRFGEQFVIPFSKSEHTISYLLEQIDIKIKQIKNNRNIENLGATFDDTQYQVNEITYPENVSRSRTGRAIRQDGGYNFNLPRI